MSLQPEKVRDAQRYEVIDKNRVCAKVDRRDPIPNMVTSHVYTSPLDASTLFLQSICSLFISHKYSEQDSIIASSEMPPKRVKQAASVASSDLSSAPSDIEATAQVTEEETVSVEIKEPQGTKRKRNISKPASTLNEDSEQSKDIKPPAKRSRQVKKEPLPEVAVDVGQFAEEEVATVVVTKTKQTRKKKITEVKEEQEEEEETAPATKGNRPVKPKAKALKEEGEEDVKKVTKKRKTKAEREAEAMPLAARTIGHKMVIGAHVSAAGGVHNATVNAVHIGANAFALFLKSQRKWANPPLDPDQCKHFHDHCDKHSYDQNKHVVPHGSYLVNLAHTDTDRTKQAYDAFVDDLHRCERLGISLYNFHPGNCLTTPRPEAIKHLASSLNRAHKETSTVITLLENMAAGGNVLGSTFEDLRDIISHVDDKSRVGVCLDTCHAFAGGYDLRDRKSLDTTLEDFDNIVGMKYLRALHLNDSKAPFQSNRDLHANIGTGFLGLRAFHAVVNEPRFQGLPMVLETPIDVRDEDGNIVKDEKGKDKEDKAIWAREIKLLESMVGMDTETSEFMELEKKLQRQGAPERKRILEQVEKKKEKKNKAGAKSNPWSKAKAKGKNVAGEESDGSALSELDSDEDEK